MIAEVGYLLLGVLALAVLGRCFWLQLRSDPLDDDFGKRAVRVFQYYLLAIALAVPALAHADRVGSGVTENALWVTPAALAGIAAIEALYRLSQWDRARSIAARFTFTDDPRVTGAVGTLLLVVSGVSFIDGELLLGGLFFVNALTLLPYLVFQLRSRRRESETAS